MLAQLFSLGGLIAFVLGVLLSGWVMGLWNKAKEATNGG